MEDTLPARQRALPAARSDAPHLCFHVVDGGRVTPVGRRTDGAYGLDVYCTGLLSVDPQGRWGCGREGHNEVGKCLNEAHADTSDDVLRLA